FAGTMGLLVVPKLLAYVLLGTQRRNRRQFGGGARVFASLVIETFLSGLIAPVMMIFQSAAIAEIALGRDAGWQVQRRDGGEVPTKELMRKYAWPTFFGVAMAASAYAVSLPLLLWMTPVLVGLLLCIPIAMLSSRVSDAASTLFLIPEETAPLRVVVRVEELARTSGEAAMSPLLALRDARLFLE